MTDKRFEKTNTITRKKVLQTWRGTLKEEKLLPVDWIRSRGVLVGIRRMERQGDFG